MIYIVLTNKSISGRYADDKSDDFIEALEFSSEETLTAWIAKNSNVRKFRVFKSEEMEVKINIEIK